MCAEVWDTDKKAWINPHDRDNHFWDCETMCLALAYILNVRHMPYPDNIQEKPKPVERREAVAHPYRKDWENSGGE